VLHSDRLQSYQNRCWKTEVDPQNSIHSLLRLASLPRSSSTLNNSGPRSTPRPRAGSSYGLSALVRTQLTGLVVYYWRSTHVNARVLTELRLHLCSGNLRVTSSWRETPDTDPCT